MDVTIAAGRPARLLPGDTAPAWALWILRFQIGVVYFYGGLMKINGDWLHGEPMRTWLPRRGHYAIIGPLLQEEFANAFMCFSRTLMIGILHHKV